MSNESKTLLSQIQELQNLNAGMSEQVKAFDAFKVETAKMIEAKDAEIKALNDAKIAAESIAKSSADELTKVKGELDSAKAQLANPAFIDASRKGSAGAGSDGGVAGSQGSDPMTKAQALDEYNKITDPKARAEFRKANASVLGL